MRSQSILPSSQAPQRLIADTALAPMPATPRGLLAIPDAIRQLEALDQRPPHPPRSRTALRRLARPGRHRDPPGPAPLDPGRGAPRGARGAPVRPARRCVGRARPDIEVRFSRATDAVGRLFALAQALTNDYEQFEALVEEGEAAGGGGEVRE